MSARDTGDFLHLAASWLRIVAAPPPVTRHVGKYHFFDTPLSVGYRRRCCIKKRITGNLIKLPNTICNPFVQPLMETVLSYPRQYVTALCNRFMQPLCTTAYGNGMQPLCATAYGNGVKLLKTICNRFMQPLCTTALYNRLWKRYATAYGNGVKLPKIPRTAAQATQGLSYLIKLSRQQNNKARRGYPNFPA
jgi:hypothetical protein